MAEHDFVIDNASASAARADINSALLAIVSNSSKATAPTVTFAYQWWNDTTANILKMRNSANSAWISIGTLDNSLNTFTVAGLPTPNTAISALPGILADGLTTTGGVITANTWKTVPVDALQINSIAGASLAANVITLPAGTYYVKWVVPIGYSGAGAAACGTRLYNVTDAGVTLNGQLGTQIGENYSGNQIHGMGAFTLAGAKGIRVEGVANNGAVSITKGLYLEIYKTT
jgi:hypothetical protein